MEPSKNLDFLGPDPDPLGPVTYAEAQALTDPLQGDLPEFLGPWKYEFVTWETEATSPEAKALCLSVASAAGIRLGDEPGQPRKRGPKPKMSEMEALEAFLGDLMRHGRDGKWSAQPMTLSAFTGPDMVGAVTFKRILRSLEKAGLVQVKKGFRAKDAKGRTKGGIGRAEATKFWATDLLFQKAQAHGIPWRKAKAHFRRPEAPERKRTRAAVEIRDLDEKAKIIALPDTEEARTTVAQVEALNAFVSRFRIQSGRPEAPEIHRPVFQRRFRGDFRLHGRLYDGGASYQHLPGWGSEGTEPWETRASLTIDGEPVVELDVHASGLTVLHGVAGVPLPDRRDLYSLPGFPRHAVKTCFTGLLGSGGTLHIWPQDTSPETRKHSFKAIKGALLAEYPFLQDLPGLLGVQDNPRLAGLVVEAIEARAVLGAVFDLMDRDMIALPIHDALVVRARHAEEARATLERHYREVTGVSPIIRVEGGPQGVQEAPPEWLQESAGESLASPG